MSKHILDADHLGELLVSLDGYRQTLKSIVTHDMHDRKKKETEAFLDAIFKLGEIKGTLENGTATDQIMDFFDDLEQLRLI